MTGWTWLGGALAGLVLLVGCAPGAAPGGTTVGPAATQAVPTLQAEATRAAPTAVALATQIGPAVGPGGATIVASSPVEIVGVQPGASDTTITLRSNSASSIDLAGWALRVGGASAALPAGTTLAPGETLTLHTAAGASAGRDVYLGQQAGALAAALRPGAHVELIDNRGMVVSDVVVPGG